MNVERCCTTEEKSSDVYDAEGKEQYYCCPSASGGWGVNVNRCCDAAQGEKQYYNYDSNNHWSPFCCPKNGGTGGWGQNVRRCCAADEIYSVGYCCPTGQMWDSTTKRCVGEEKACATNDDCLANEFCAYPNATSCREKPTKGVCKPATVSHTKKINGKTYKRSSDYMNFWSAKNFCARIGSMVSVSDFACGYDFVTNKKSGFCNTGTALVQDGSGTRSDTMKLFMSGLGSRYVWTDDEYDACDAYGVHLNNGYVTDTYRLSSQYYALCRVGGS